MGRPWGRGERGGRELRQPGVLGTSEAPPGPGSSGKPRVVESRARTNQNSPQNNLGPPGTCCSPQLAGPATVTGGWVQPPPPQPPGLEGEPGKSKRGLQAPLRAEGDSEIITKKAKRFLLCEPWEGWAELEVSTGGGEQRGEAGGLRSGFLVRGGDRAGEGQT